MSVVSVTSGLLLTSALMAGSAAEVPRRYPDGPWLTDVRIHGAEADWPGIWPRDPDLPDLRPERGDSSKVAARQTAYAARAALGHPLPEWWQSVPLVRPYTPVPAADIAQLEADAEALRLWFMDRGFLDCTVSLELTADDSAWGAWLERRAPGQTRRATFLVSAGERWTISSVELDGLEGVQGALLGQLLAAVEVVPGDYDGVRRANTETAFRRLLSANGYPFPKVSSELVPDSVSGSLTLRFRVDTGPSARFGEVTVDGLTALDRKRIRARLAPRITPGEPWDATRLDDFEAALDRIPSFAQVTVTPGQIDDEQRVPVRVSVSEAEAGGWSPVVALGADPTLYAAELGAVYRHKAVGRQLASFESRTSAGYRVFPVGVQPESYWGNHGPVARQLLSSDLVLRPLSGLSVALEAGGELEALRAANLVTVSASGGLRVRPARGMVLSVLPELAHWRSFAWPQQEELWSKWFVSPGDPPLPPMSGLLRPRFRPSSTGALLHLTMDWNRVDRPMMPTQGGILALDLVPWGTADGDAFVRAEMSAKRFIPLGTPRLVLVPRLEGGLLRFKDPTAMAVPQLRLYQGGGAGLRGWGVRQANPPGWDGGLNDFRIGGNVSAMGSLELRYALWPRLHMFGFSDVGRTWESLVDRVDPISGEVEPGAAVDTLLPAAGAGIALPTPVGRAAMSTAIRLRQETELLHPPPMIMFHFVLVPSL